jgi:hypothetical protein
MLLERKKYRRIGLIQINKWMLLLALLFFQFACNKITAVDPPLTSLTSDNVYQNDATANSVLIGLYTSIGTSSPLRGQTFNSISLVTGLSSDELTLYGGAANVNANLAAYYLNKLSSGSPSVSSQSIWNDTYSKIYITNIALERLQNSTQLTSIVKSHLIGEVKFLRAFFYFYLVNLYGDVPLALSSDYRTNASLSRAEKSKVYSQIITDLKDAQDELSSDFVALDGKTATTERLRPNKYAAASLLARTYLCTSEWAKAEEQATIVINNSSKFKLTSLDNTFLKNSDEAIWQLQPVNLGWNTEDAKAFILPASGPTSSSVEGYPVYISSQLVGGFESNDLRKSSWTGKVTVNNTTYYYPLKYKSATLNAPLTEYQMVFRLAEQYLIRAEARAQLSNLNGAKFDLDVIRTRAGLKGTDANDNPSILKAIQHERQIELFTEWGQRWIDLKRTGAIDVVMNVVAPQKETSWNSNWQLYPIPLYDIIRNSNLGQNFGY